MTHSADPQAPRKAAVLIAIVAYDDPMVLLIRRPGHMRRHAGQIACPGGIYEEADGDLQITALRETEEEIGLAPQSVRIVRRIRDVFTHNSNFLVTPFVGVIAPPIALRVNTAEIDDVYEVPLRAIRAQGAVHLGEEKVGELRVLSWTFDHGEVHVWGATGRILHEFLEVLKDTDAADELEQAISQSRQRVE